VVGTCGDGIDHDSGDVRRNFSIGCLIFAWLCANGALWNTVQVVGWAKMIRNYSNKMPMAKALEVTFDGSAPCDLCHMSEKAENTARQQLPRDAMLGGGMKKLLFATEELAPVVLITPEFIWPGIVNDVGIVRPESVPVPPPRNLS